MNYEEKRIICNNCERHGRCDFESRIKYKNSHCPLGKFNIRTLFQLTKKDPQPFVKKFLDFSNMEEIFPNSLQLKSEYLNEIKKAGCCKRGAVVQKYKDIVLQKLNDYGILN